MIVTGFHTAADGIAREAALLKEGKPSLLLWQAHQNALVLPSAMTRCAGIERIASSAAKCGWPVTTRGSGGGIVPQGPGTLNLAMVVPCRAGFSMDDGFRLICGAISEALTRFDVTSTTGACPGAFCDGTWNVMARGRKLAGSAQRWHATPSGRIALVHAAILTSTPDPGIWPVLRKLQTVAAPSALAPRADAHIALDDLMPGTMNITGFPGALVRAAEDRLTTLAQRRKEAA